MGLLAPLLRAKDRRVPGGWAAYTSASDMVGADRHIFRCQNHTSPRCRPPKRGGARSVGRCQRQIPSNTQSATRRLHIMTAGGYSQDTANPNELAELSAAAAAAASAASLRMASADTVANRPPNAFGRGTPRATALFTVTVTSHAFSTTSPRESRHWKTALVAANNWRPAGLPSGNASGPKYLATRVGER